MGTQNRVSHQLSQRATISARTVALVYNTDIYLHGLRGGLREELKAQGYQVFAVAPAGPAVPAIERDGITFIDWPVTRRAINLLAELKGILRLWRIYRRIRPDIVPQLTPKPSIYGAMAAHLAGVPVVIASSTSLAISSP